MSPETLKPCPFCGGEPGVPLDLDGGRRQWWVECKSCGAMSPNCEGPNGAAEAWNKRAYYNAAPPAGPSEREKALEEAVRAAIKISDETLPMHYPSVRTPEAQAVYDQCAAALAFPTPTLAKES